MGALSRIFKMSDTEIKSVEPSFDDYASFEEAIYYEFGDLLSAFEITVRSGSSNHEVKRRYEFREPCGDGIAAAVSGGLATGLNAYQINAEKIQEPGLNENTEKPLGAGFQWPEPVPHPQGHPQAVNASWRSTSRLYEGTGEQVISFELETGQRIWLRLDATSAKALAESLIRFQELGASDG